MKAGEVVVELRNADLDYELAAVLGEKATAQQQLDTITATLGQLGRATAPLDQARFAELTAKMLELNILLQSLANRLELLRREQKNLSIQAKISGQVQTWDVAAQLKSRPVRQGEQLMTIVNVDGPWRLDVRVPDQHIGYVNAARRALKNDLAVSFVRKSDPQRVCRGHVQRVAASTEFVQNYGASVLVTVAIGDAGRFEDRRPGTTVIAKIHCGRKPLAYVWLHDLLEAARRRLLF